MAPGMPVHAGSRCAFSLLPFRTFSLLLFGIRLLLLTAAATPNHRNLESVLRHRPAANAHFLVGGRGIYRKHLGTYDCRSLGRFLAALFNNHLFRNFRRLNRPVRSSRGAVSLEEEDRVCLGGGALDDSPRTLLDGCSII